MARVMYECGMCGERFDEPEDAINHCPAEEWEGSGPAYFNEVSSCCGGEIGTGHQKEHPLGRNEPGHIYYEIPVCVECGEELEE